MIRVFKFYFIWIFSCFFIASPVLAQLNEKKSDIKPKFDFETGFMGGGINFSIKLNDKNALGIGGIIGYYNILLTPNYFLESGTKLTFDYLSVKLFYRFNVNHFFIIEPAAKFSITMFGEEDCEPCSARLYGFLTTFIIGQRKIKFKPGFGFVKSIEKPTYFIYFTPLVVSFKL
jgi:hypothetical protein